MDLCANLLRMGQDLNIRSFCACDAPQPRRAIFLFHGKRAQSRPITIFNSR